MNEVTENKQEICGLRGDSDVGYCICIKPANHTEDIYSPHACEHEAWN